MTKGNNFKQRKRGNGEGSIYKRPNGTWAGMITYGKDDNGKPKRKSFSAKTQEELIRQMNTFKSGLLNNSYIEPNTITVKKWLNDWLVQYKSIKLKPTTFDCYETIINKTIIHRIGDIPLQELRPEAIQSFYNDIYKGAKGKGVKSTTLRKIHIILKGALQRAVVNELIKKNPAQNPELPLIRRKQVKAFTLEEQKVFIGFAKEYRLYQMFITGIDTGLRLSELIALTWDDIDFQNNEIVVNNNVVLAKDRSRLNSPQSLLLQETTKTESGDGRRIPMTTRLITMLKEAKLKYQSITNVVFPNTEGKFLRPRNVERTFEKIIKKAGIEKCNVHTLRHTYATRLFEKDYPAKAVSELLGHSSVVVTLNIYMHLLKSKKEKSAKILDGINDEL